MMLTVYDTNSKSSIDVTLGDSFICLDCNMIFVDAFNHCSFPAPESITLNRHGVAMFYHSESDFKEFVGVLDKLGISHS